MHRILAIGLTLSLLCLHNNGATSSTMPDPVASALTVEDPAGNLSGDGRRSYMDLTELRLRSGASERTLELQLAGPFPNPDFMLGTGFRFDIAFQETGASLSREAPTRHQLQVRLGQHHWTWTLESPLDPVLKIESEIRIEATTHTLRIHLPEALFTGIEILEIRATTEEFPKWAPLTTHPPVTLSLGTEAPAPR